MHAASSTTTTTRRSLQDCARRRAGGVGSARPLTHPPGLLLPRARATGSADCEVNAQSMMTMSRRAALLSALTTTTAAAVAVAPAAASPSSSSFDPLSAAASALASPSSTTTAGSAAGSPLPLIPRAPPIPRAPALRGLSAVVRGTRQLDGQHRGTPPQSPPPPPIGGGDSSNPNPSDRTRGGEAIADLNRFWRAGVTSFETSDAFGGAETLLGQFLRLEQRRKDDHHHHRPHADQQRLIVTLSLDGRGGGSGGQLTRADVRPAALELRVRAACARLGVASLDHVQLSWQGGDAPGRGAPMPVASSSSSASSSGRRRLLPFGGGGGGRKGDGDAARSSSSTTTPLWLDALLALQDLRARKGGLVKGVGVVGFSAQRLLRALDSGVDVATNLVPLSVVDRRAVSQRGLSSLCVERRVALLARGSMLGGFLQGRFLGAPASAARLDTAAKLEYGRVVAAAGGWAHLQEQLEVLDKLGKKHGVSCSSVALRWALQQEGVAAVVVGARNAAHVGDLRAAFSFALTEDEMLDLDAAYESAVQPTGDVGEWERGGGW